MKLSRKTPGFSLVEVALAIGIAGFCLISILGLIPVGLNMAQNASAQTGAVDIIGAVAADLRAASTTGTTSPYFKFAFSNTTTKTITGKTLYMDDGGHYDTELSALPNARYRVEVKTVADGSSLSASIQNIIVTWPARASVSAATGKAESVVALDLN